MMKYALLVGGKVQFHRAEYANTLTGIKRKQTEAIGYGYETELLDTSITVVDSYGETNYAVIDRDGSQIGWRKAGALDF